MTQSMLPETGSRSIQEWLIVFDVAKNPEESNSKLQQGLIRLNGNLHTTCSYIPFVGDVLSTLDGYSFRIPGK